MPDSFRCKEEACGLTLEYVRQVLPGVIGFQVRKAVQPSTVYLTCDNGHVHPYTLSSPGGSGA